MSNIEGQVHRIVGPASLAEILGLGSKRPEPAKPLGAPSDDMSGYSRAQILAESTGRNIDPRFVGLGTGVTTPRRFA